uniref:Uncharacterized protein n=1 Tax=Chromera velia CCMP2878 TaxID=1169474 RepID=A0A0G4GEQ5_9ALVE|eukprot:Cvel_4595.t1-p1 / transcript=Cvel_4595.t1 / gene=Cvel_4595 / organism=Chromera_velia_CCMP2878 / gene_product=Zinc finger protein 571, putative / transcript_product=Zinc finger protein 571, putative / location=Cvel_scaffold202:8184-8777(+) / protein_length=198 / sequence_SO=supercontig / SO=protein_coding / is_pseudo=false
MARRDTDARIAVEQEYVITEGKDIVVEIVVEEVSVSTAGRNIVVEIVGGKASATTDTNDISAGNAVGVAVDANMEGRGQGVKSVAGKEYVSMAFSDTGANRVGVQVFASMVRRSIVAKSVEQQGSAFVSMETKRTFAMIAEMAVCLAGLRLWGQSLPLSMSVGWFPWIQPRGNRQWGREGKGKTLKRKKDTPTLSPTY